MGKDDQDINKPSESKDTEMLTPWQKENLKYLEHVGDQPRWKTTEEPNVIKAEETEKNVDKKDQPAEGSEDIEVIEEPAKEGTKDGPTLETVKDLPKSKSFADKLPKMKEARQKRLKRRLTLLISVFGIGAIGTMYYVSPLSKLNKIEIVGNELVTSEAIAASTKLTGKEFIWTAYFNNELIPRIKKENPRIKDVDIRLSRLNNLKVTVTEYAEVAYAKENQTIHAVLENGTILREPTEIKNETFPVLIDFKEGDNLNYLMASFSKINPEVMANIKEIKSTPSSSNAYLMTMTMKDGNQIIASTRDYQDKINYYPQVIADNPSKGIVDMEAGIFFTTFESIEAEKKAAQAEKERLDWEKQVEEENNQNN
ncbi:FtsQ-type POTRA domain-containing protein [Vagococcus sp. BWB3-3]|uniref:Cell division protein DivIB n=1 Tax=Vagococcus allomyrinae TaxID=2794353 RepID=A0A940P5R1_9ENTE|nr:cell division protein FtsQ/DivIB [Vagococcus allomyrinae]MBP1041525.1 FtsQ-type POTRA domain-containing protein [Vagococcus allomyrinae]